MVKQVLDRALLVLAFDRASGLALLVLAFDRESVLAHRVSVSLAVSV
jgi:hypothetical protein